MWNRFIKNDKGFTGLEAAIVLIAFVVVAAVFSYVMLGAGFYTTQKSQEVVHTGVTQASSSIAPSGDVIVKGGALGKAAAITFYITSTAGGTPVDLDKTIITYTDASEAITFDETSDAWDYDTIIEKTGGSDNLLEANEKIKIVLDLSKVGSAPGANEHIKLEVKPPEGAVLTLTRTMPPALTDGAYYPVY
ncbi:MAG: archaellin/type IV pilin N-terminal domain-containing protein [Methanosarcina mazei]